MPTANCLVKLFLFWGIICETLAFSIKISSVEESYSIGVAKARFGKLLKRDGYFLTKPRLRLFRVLHAHDAMTTQEILDRLERLDQATVYRNLNLFEELGVVRRLQMGWHTRFELTDIFQPHHHHLSCLKCNRVTVLPEDSVLESEITRLSYRHKFRAIDHQLEIRGLCASCA